jgi:hypothetical protein
MVGDRSLRQTYDTTYDTTKQIPRQKKVGGGYRLFGMLQIL